MRHPRISITHIACLALLFTPGLALAQSPPAPAPSTSPAASAQPSISDAQLAQVVAPVALYPDSLLSQILMAATYPVQIVEADRWLQANTSLKDDNLALALENQPWDPSVKSLINFPTVLTMLSTNLSATSTLGDAFLADQKRVMAMVQSLRAKARSAGNLSNNSQQTISVTQAPADSSTSGGTASSDIISIAPADPQEIYVPTYDPNYAYGYWPYTTYTPYYYNPGYAYRVGFANGVAWGYAWGNADWRSNHLLVNVNQNTTTQSNWAIDRSRYTASYSSNPNFKDGQGAWQHDPGHRDGVAYRDQATAARYASYSGSSTDAQSRQAYRGHDTASYSANSYNSPEMVARRQAAAQESQAHESPERRQARAQQYSQQEQVRQQEASRQQEQRVAQQQTRYTAINSYNRGSEANRQALERGYASRNYSMPTQRSGNYSNSVHRR